MPIPQPSTTDAILYYQRTVYLKGIETGLVIPVSIGGRVFYREFFDITAAGATENVSATAPAGTLNRTYQRIVAVITSTTCTKIQLTRGGGTSERLRPDINNPFTTSRYTLIESEFMWNDALRVSFLGCTVGDPIRVGFYGFEENQ